MVFRLRHWQFTGTVQDDALAGARSVHLDTSGKIVPGFTGLSNLSGYWAAEVFITQVTGQQLQLSKPLPRALRRGEHVQLATLKYKPFSLSDSVHGEETLAGWVRYVDVVSRFAIAALGTADAADKGFDLEIWNELSMGSNFLSINNYYDPPVDSQPAYLIWDKIVGKRLNGLPRRLQNLKVSGCATVSRAQYRGPRPAPSRLPSRRSASTPIRRWSSFPRDNQSNTQTLDFDGRPTKWVPKYSACFPEYFATGIQTETIVRDMGSATSEIYGIKHGRLARTDGAGPVPVWITEMGINPAEAGITGTKAGELLKAKATARTLLFYLNKGSERVYLFCASGKPGGYGLVNDQTSSDTSHALDVVSRITKVMRVDDHSDPLDNLELEFAVHSPTASGLAIHRRRIGIQPTLSQYRHVGPVAVQCRPT